jgi:hypothetical protein
MKLSLSRGLAVALAVSLGGFASARAQDADGAKNDVKRDDGKKALLRRPIKDADTSDGDEEKEFPAFDATTKDYVPAEGFFDLYYRAKDQGLYALVPSSELERPFLFTSSLSGGTPQAGWQISDQLVTWERLGKKLVLVEKNVQHRADPERPIADAVVRTYSDRVILSTPILSESPKGYLINLKEILVDHARTFLGLSVDGSLAKVTKKKAFPTNVELAFSAPLYGDGTIISWHYSIARLPDSDFRPRVADDRVGYFLTAIKDYTKGDPNESRFLRFVNRWDLRKASPELAISPPKKPIVFYIEKTVPFRYRRYVEAGILEWNKAFEKCGFSGAMVVRQQTADNEFKDFDPEDARYNFLRWIVSDEGYAMGPSRVDPRTGQILDADIVFDDSMVEFYAQDYEQLLKAGPQVYRGSQPSTSNGDARAFADRLSQALEPLGIALDSARATEALDRLAGTPVAPSQPAKTAAELAARLRSNPPRDLCRIGAGISHELALATMAKLALESDDSGTLTKNVPEDFIGEIVKETVMHEVGHTLGLRHNFKGSSWRTLEEINSADRPGDVSASVMDYNPINIAPQGLPQGHYQNTTIGPYDMWAIEYGYRPSADGKGELEPADLAQIGARSNEPGHAYGTDEDLADADPLCVQWDMGSDPVAFAKCRIELARKLRDKLLMRAVHAGDSWEKLRRAFEMVLFEQARAGQFAARIVGSHEVRRNHKGDPGEMAPLVLVPAAKQRAALAYACEQLFDDAAFKFPPDLLAHLGAGRWSHWGSDGGQNPGYPIHERVLLAQRYALDTFLAPGVFDRLRDAQAQAAPGDDVITIEELFATIEKSIFAEIGPVHTNGNTPSARTPVISTFRQNLQDAYVKRLVALAVTEQAPFSSLTSPASKIAAARLRGLAETVTTALGSGKLDEDSRAHLEALSKHMVAVQGAQYVHLASGSVGCALEPFEGTPMALAPLLAALLAIFVLRLRRS